MKKVLVVDDQPAIRKLLYEVLKDEFDVELAGSGEEAIAITGEYKPHIMLLDVGLSGISGIDALPSIKEKVPECKVVILTGSADNLLLNRALSLGAADFIGKPFDIIKVKDKLKTLA